MWRRKQHRQRGYNGEKRENYKAQTIHDHRSEFPVTCNVACFVLFLKLCASGKYLKHHNQYNVVRFPRLTWSVIQRSSFSISANSYSAEEPRQVWEMASCMRASPTAATGPTGPTGPTLPSSPCLWEELSESINQSISQLIVQASMEYNNKEDR